MEKVQEKQSINLTLIGSISETYCNPLVTKTKKLSIKYAKQLFLLAPAVGIEPTTN